MYICMPLRRSRRALSIIKGVHEIHMYMYGASGFPGIDAGYWVPPPRQGKHRGGWYVTKTGMLLGCLSRPPPTYIGSLRPSSVSISFVSGAGLARASGRSRTSSPYKNRSATASLPPRFPLALRGLRPPRPARPRWKGSRQINTRRFGGRTFYPRGRPFYVSRPPPGFGGGRDTGV